MKTCPKCLIERPTTEFHKSKNRKDGLYYICKVCTKSQNKKWADDNKEHRKVRSANYYKNNKDECTLRGTKWHYKKHYNIEYEDFLNLIKQQQGKCACCDVELTLGPKTKTRAVLDHCHFTGSLRKVLCNRCNTAIGLFEDNANLLQAASVYLKENQN